MELLLAGLLIAIAGTAVAAMKERHADLEPVEIEPDPFEDHPMHCKCYYHG